MKKRLLLLLLIFSLSIAMISCNLEALDDFVTEMENESQDIIIDIDGFYSSQEEVALYINTYKELPSNFLTKNEAEELGWVSSKGNLWDVTDKMSIGGNGFGNREKLLPIKDGRRYFECDINYMGGYRNAERIIYSNDGLIFYTDDHYESFTKLYGDE